MIEKHVNWMRFFHHRNDSNNVHSVCSSVPSALFISSFNSKMCTSNALNPFNWMWRPGEWGFRMCTQRSTCVCVYCVQEPNQWDCYSTMNIRSESKFSASNEKMKRKYCVLFLWRRELWVKSESQSFAWEIVMRLFTQKCIIVIDQRYKNIKRRTKTNLVEFFMFECRKSSKNLIFQCATPFAVRKIKNTKMCDKII